MKIFIIGTGNVATTLGSAIVAAGHKVTGVFGRNTERAKKLAEKLNSRAVFSLKDADKVSDIFLIAVNDNAIKDVAAKLPAVRGIVVHTSGSTHLNVLEKHKQSGVFYPVESITVKFPVSFRKVPVCLEASNEKTMKTLMAFASTLSEKLYVLSSEQRQTLHLAAVFTNNFTNHLLHAATGLLEKAHVPGELLQPLAVSTVKNAFNNGPLQSQTGPAVRNDTKTINRHLQMLQNNTPLFELYKLITGQIKETQSKKKSG